MSSRRVKALLLACAGVGALCAATIDANAGGFALREQSAYGQGASFAGIAAGGALSSMFWNPATMTQVPGIQIEAVGSGILPYSANTPGAGSTLAGFPFGFGGTGNTGEAALVPSFYASWQVNPKMWVGLSFNAPFGLTVNFPDLWAGRDFAANKTSLKTYNATPSIAYQINDWISVGVGMQIQYGDASLSRGITAGFGLYPDSNLSGTGWAYGFTAGVTLTPTPTTTIGLGYRSALNQKIDGSLALTGVLAGFSNPNVHTTLNLPDIVSLGLRQKVGAQWTVLGTVEWSNWSRIGTSAVTNSAGAPVLIGVTPVTVPFNYSDGWFYSLGAEYQWNPQLALRAGIGYEKSPITDAVRTPLLPDNDRTWLSVGSTYKVSNKLSFDFAYSHLFVKSTSVSDVTSTGIVYNGTVSSHVDIVSLALKYRWDDPAPAVKQGFFKAK